MFYMMNKHGFGVEVIVDLDDKIISKRPSCPHGPMLLFERYTVNGRNNGRRFFACSANRSRKFCNSFYWAAEISKSNKVLSSSEHQFASNCSLKPEKHSHKRNNDKFCSFCQTCSLRISSEEYDDHKGHEVRENISNEQLARPSRLLSPQVDSRQYAQYFFSEDTVQFLINTLKNLQINNVLCIGAPRVHEQLLLSDFKSILMDIDDRYAQFYNCRCYLKYNMFNNYFFESKVSAYKKILLQDRLCVLLDPPFGGLVDALAHTLKQIFGDWKQMKSRDTGLQPLILWFFPYFNEKRIVEAFPGVQMLDFKIDYENHHSFKEKESVGSSKHGSPIRIFTNYEPKLFKAPDSTNYRFCTTCQKYVAKGNVHCMKCQACTSKDGHPYKHCDVCNLCVKISWHHCTKCQKCVTQDHKCGTIPTPGLCHVCGCGGHKRKQCPEQYKKKRKKMRISEK